MARRRTFVVDESQKALLTFLLAWGTASVLTYAFAFGLVGCYFPMAVEMVYGIAGLANFFYLRRTRRGYEATAIAHTIAVLVVTAIISFGCGGILQSGVFIFWGLISPVAALVFLGLRAAALATTGYVVVIILLVVRVWTATWCVAIPPHLQSIFAAANTIGASVLILATLFYFVRLLERERAEREKVQSNLTRQQKLESLATLAGGIAHDFNNILMALMGNMTILRSTCADDTSASQRIAKAEEAIKRAASLTRQLLTFSKGGTPVAGSTSLGQIAEETALFALHGTNCTCRFEIPPDLWPASGNSDQLSQVIQNLVLNASQAMPHGGEIVLECSNVFGDEVQELTPGGEYVCLKVVDTGVGIDPEHLARIFDPYFTTRSSGSGLGLASAYSIVRSHQGSITVESTPNLGTTFSIFVPAADLTSDELKVVPSSPIGRRRVLIMDDDPAVLDALEDMLAQLGHEVLSTTHGEEAMEAMVRESESGSPIEAYILDLTIKGGVGGVETAKAILDEVPDACIIASSGYSNAPVMAQPQHYGFADTLQKPYDLKLLETVLSRNLPRG